MLNQSQVNVMDEGLPRTLQGGGAGMFLSLKGKGTPQRVGRLKRRSWYWCPGRLGMSCAFFCVVAAVPALHSESLCWSPSVPLRERESTVCLLEKAWSLGPQRLTAVCIWNKLSCPELHKPSQDPPSFCGLCSVAHVICQ